MTGLKPLIGVQAQIDMETDTLMIKPGYLEFVHHAGGFPVLFAPPQTPEEAKACIARFDGILIPGGDDINPALYGEEPLPGTDTPIPLRDNGEPLLLDAAYTADIPVLGICRGTQMMHVHAGGGMYQDVLSQREGSMNHWQEEPYAEPHHEVAVAPDTPLATLLKEAGMALTQPVNSIHHQAIRPPFANHEVLAATSSDGSVEAICFPGQTFAMGVQWHPELMLDNPFSQLIGNAFISAAAAYAAR